MNRTAPAVTDFGRLEFPAIETSTLKSANGAPVGVHLLNLGNKNLCRVSLVWPNEGIRKKPAASRVMARSLRNGARNFPNSRIDRILDINGAWLATNSNPDYTLLHIYSLNHRLEHVLPVVAAIISAPTFPRKHLDWVKETMADNQRMNDTRVDLTALTRVKQLVMGTGHRRSVKLTADDFLNVSRADAVRAFDSSIKETAPQVWVAGMVDNNVLKAVEAFVASLNVGAAETANSLTQPFRPEEETESMMVLPDAKQSAVVLGKELPAVYHPDHHLVTLAVHALGGYFGSRLNKTVREEKGLTYGIYAFNNPSLDGDICAILAQTAKKNVPELIESTREELVKLHTSPLSADEVSALRRTIVSSTTSGIENPFALADKYINLKADGLDTDFLEQQQNAVLSFTAADIARVAGEYLRPEGFVVVTAGN